MENASKALIMAAGILIALLIIGALLLMFNQIGDYEKAQSSNEKVSQIADFNKEFEGYTDDNGITGGDIISLINKVIDYNNKAKKGGVANSVNYDIKMSIKVSGLNNFNEKYAYDKEKDKDSLFTDDSYSFTEKNDLKDLLDSFSAAEKNISIANLKILSATYNPSKSKDENITNIKEKLIEIEPKKYKSWDGESPTPTLDTIKKYRQYSEFKTSTFVVDGNPVYKDGQIKELSFKFSR